MELWIEGTIDQVVAVANSGLASAIATNPAIIERWTSDGKSLQYVVAQVCDQVDVPIYVQLHGPNVNDYLREIEQLRRISDKIHPKLVSTHAGIAAAKRIASAGAKPLVTTIATLNQAFLAASAGAAYVAPYVGRMVAAGVDAYQIIADIAALYQRHGIRTQITAASIGSPEDAEKVLLAGAPVLVMQHAVFERLLDSELTQAWIDRFEDNWSRIPIESQSYEKENG